MQRLALLLLICSAVLSLALVACQRPTATSPTVIYVTATPEPTPAPTPIAPQGEPGGCEHLLWPLRDGASWVYRLAAGGEVRDIVLTTSVGPTGATLTADGQERALICGEDMLAGLPPLPLGHPGLGPGITASNPIGEYLPAPARLLPLGQPANWDQEGAASGMIRLPIGSGDDWLPITGGKVVLIQSTLELESVSVPAGDFLALPVQQDVLLDVQVQLADGAMENVLISAAARQYYAEGVGLVLARYDGGTVSTSAGAWPLEAGLSLELVSWSLP